MRFFVICVMVCLSVVVAGETQFQNSKAKRAKDKFDKAVQRATDQYRKDLKLALKDAMKNLKLEDAKAIQSEIERLEKASTAPKDFVGTLCKENKPDTVIVIQEDLTYEFKNIKQNQVWHSGKVVETKDGFDLLVSDGRKISLLKKKGYYYRPDNKEKYTKK